jgi:hypothetical protein
MDIRLRPNVDSDKKKLDNRKINTSIQVGETQNKCLDKRIDFYILSLFLR